MVVKFLGEPAQFVLLVHAGVMQGGLVEWQEHDRVDSPLLEHLKAVQQVAHHPPATCHRRDAAFHLLVGESGADQNDVTGLCALGGRDLHAHLG